MTIDAMVPQGLAGPVTADSEPDYDGWGPDSYWTCGDWLNWYLANRKRYGREAAKRKFVPAWERNGPLSAAEKCPYDTVMVDTLLRDGIDIRTWVSAVVNPVVGGGAKLAEGAETVVKDTARTAKMLGYAVPVLVTGTVAAVGYYVWKNYLKGDRRVSAYGVEF